jgi:hypothetical protein
MDEVATEVMQIDEVVELFQTMAIVNLNMGNLNLEVSSLKNKLATKRRRQYCRWNWTRRGTSRGNTSIT